MIVRHRVRSVQHPRPAVSVRRLERRRTPGAVRTSHVPVVGLEPSESRGPLRLQQGLQPSIEIFQ